MVRLLLGFAPKRLLRFAREVEGHKRNIQIKEMVALVEVWLLKTFQLYQDPLDSKFSIPGLWGALGWGDGGDLLSASPPYYLELLPPCSNDRLITKYN